MKVTVPVAFGLDSLPVVSKGDPRVDQLGRRAYHDPWLLLGFCHDCVRTAEVAVL